MPDEVFSIGDPVWAKLKGFCPWPGKVTKAPEGLKQPAAKKKALCVYFFGAENYAFIESQFIKPFVEYRDKLCRASKSNQFKEALSEIDEYIVQRGTGADQTEDTSKSKSAPSKPVKNNETPSKLSKSKDSTKSTKSSETLSTKKSGSTSAEDSKAKKQSGGQSAKKSSGGQRKQAETSPVNGTPAKRARKSKATESQTEEAAASKRRRVRSSSSSSSREQPSPEFLTSSVRASGPVAGPSPSLHADSYGVASPSASTKRVASLLDRPALLRRPESPPLDVGHVSSVLKQKNIQPSDMRIGLLGLGAMGSGMARNLLNSGHQMSVWNRSSEKCDEFVKAGAEMCITPSDVVGTTDVTLLCVSDPHVSKEIIFGNCGVLQEINTTKGYVEMTTVDSDTSQDVADAIAAKGGRYLEAQVQGSREEAQEGTLVILCAGDRSLFDDCQSCFQAIAKNAFYFGEVGNASRMNLVLQLLRGVQLTALAEAMALADRAGIKLADVLDVLALTSQACPLLLEKGKAIIEGSFTTQMALKYMQKDLRLCMGMSDQLEQPLPLTAAANETFKQAKRVGYGDHDVSAVYIRARF